MPIGSNKLLYELKETRMNNSLKGALLSGLVFPGLGQVILKHAKRGVVLMLIVLAGLFVVVLEGAQQALTLLEKNGLQGPAFDMKAISNAAAQASTTFGSLTFNCALSLIILCWVIAVVDAYRIGRKKDPEQQTSGQISIGQR
jgi:hypothetical protein